MLGLQPLKCDNALYGSIYVRSQKFCTATEQIRGMLDRNVTDGVVVKRRPHNAEVHDSRSSWVPLSLPVLVTLAPDAK